MAKMASRSASKREGHLSLAHFLLTVLGALLSLCVSVASFVISTFPLGLSSLPADFLSYLHAYPAFRPLAIGASAGIVFFLSWTAVLSALHVRPLRKFMKAMADVIGGDYAVRVKPCRQKSWNAACERFNLMVKGFRKKIAVEKYVSKSTAQMVENLKTGEFSTAPHRQDATVFFSDIRGFTPYTEKHDPLDVVQTVNEIFDIQVDLIHRFEGDIDKYIGDAVMAIFMSPAQAFKAATEIQKKMASFNQSRKDKLYIGIGINSGQAVMGAIGARDSLNWTVMGDVVNTAERICSNCPGGQIYVSAEANAQIKTRRPSRTETLKLKGRKSATQVFIYGSGPSGSEEEE